MKIGVIGAGLWGKKHVEEYTKLKHQVYVSDLSPENLSFCETNFHSKSVQDYKDIILDDEIKAISICSPNSTHYRFAKKAIEAGKAVLIEKPIAENTVQANELISLAKSRKTPLLVGHIFRFNNAIKKTKEIVNCGTLGKIYHVNLDWTGLENIFPDRDILFDMAVHPIDILDNLFEKIPKNIICSGMSFRQENFETSVISYDLPINEKDSIFVTINLSWLNPLKIRRMLIVGSDKSLQVECTSQQIKIIENTSKNVIYEKIIPNNTIRDELDYFIKCCSEMKEPQYPYPTGEIGKRILHVIETANNFALKK